ncbi:aldo/keto reductase [Halobacteria archaeon AArc-m2/3/4]|uniref:Aldo/keto reductase n=1 Tax=Natronoglomus mannanivorans TaxID=2979990 RepID=A0AAP2Z3S9_9EURY|nr:aldo/keto reductase [Halobacteria archaeon AArc-xg1-1]MCU4974954.1 aldo/keto reductase [Halobacteria archaeon AArc-m2/3/4]
MEYTKLGSTGLDVSKVCFGTWRFNKESDGTVETDRETAHELLDRFADHGGNFIDTANGYGDGESERWIGEWLGDRDREDYVIASKVYWSQVSRFDENLSRKNIRAEIEGTLERLDTDYIDVYYIHRWDDDTPIRETLRTLTRLVEEGKVHYLAASSMAAWKLTKALWTSDVDGLERFEVTQPRFNAADRPQEYLDVCGDQGLAVCPWSPLDGGVLTGKYATGDADEGSRADLDGWDMSFSDRQQRVLEAVQDVADDLEATPAQVSLRWLIEQREFTCVPIFGARTLEQMDENVGAADISLSDEQYEQIADAY